MKVENGVKRLLDINEQLTLINQYNISIKEKFLHMPSTVVILYLSIL